LCYVRFSSFAVLVILLICLHNVAHRLIPMLLACGKQSNTLTNQMVSATLTQLISCISDEHDASFLASLFKAFADCLHVIGGASVLPQEYRDGILEATKRQLGGIADKRRNRSARRASSSHDLGSSSSEDGMGDARMGGPAGAEDDSVFEDDDDLVLIEEMEDFALEDMGKMLKALEAPTEILVALGSVRELGSGRGYGDGI
jgi:importin-5